MQDQRSTAPSPSLKTILRRWLFRIATIVIGIVIGVLLVEGAMRMVGIARRYSVVHAGIFTLVDDETLEYALLPGAPDRHQRISSAGLRDREFTIEKPDGVYRIAAIGDSVTFGLFSDWTQTYPRRLESLLNESVPDGPQFEVMNFGVVGYNAVQIARQLETKVMSYDPDLIIYGYVLNDPQTFSLELEKLRRLEDVMRFGQSDSPYRPLHRALDASRIYRLIRSATVRPPDRLREQIPEPLFKAMREGNHHAYMQALHTGASWESTRHAITRMARVARDTPILFVLFPTQSCMEDEEHQKLANIRTLVLDTASKNAMPTLDLLNPMRRAAAESRWSIFVDLLHPAPVGNDIAAAAIAAHLLLSGDDAFASIDLDRVASDHPLRTAAITSVTGDAKPSP